MLLLSTSLPVPLEVLNNRSQAIARFDATLLHLHGDCAVLSLPAQASLSLVHWGTQVRFWISDGPHGYEVEGVVTARDTELLSTALPTQETPQSQQTAKTQIRRRQRKTARRVKSWSDLRQCLPFEERRADRRRWTRFSVRLHPCRNPKALRAKTRLENITDVAAESARWERVWAVDISGGGMRLRTYACLPVRQRFLAQFWLPDMHAKTMPPLTPAVFRCKGRVLRSEKARTRAAEAYETMLCFEHLSTEDGLALSRFLTM